MDDENGTVELDWSLNRNCLLLVAHRRSPTPPPTPKPSYQLSALDDSSYEAAWDPASTEMDIERGNIQRMLEEELRALQPVDNAPHEPVPNELEVTPGKSTSPINVR